MFKADSQDPLPNSRRAVAAASAALLGLSLLLSFAPVLAAAKDQGKQENTDKVTLCHAVNDVWNAITTDVSGLNGHNNHTGDIIPVVGSYGGLNLSTDFGGTSGSDILANGCETPPVVEEQPPSENEAPAEEQPPSEEEAPSQEEQPLSENEGPSDEQPPSEEEAPSQDEATAGEQPPTEEEALSQDEAPVDEEAPHDEQPPTEDVAPSKDEVPADEQPPTEEVDPSQDEAPAELQGTQTEQGTRDGTAGSTAGGTLPDTALPQPTGILAALGVLLLIAAHAGMQNRLDATRR